MKSSKYLTSLVGFALLLATLSCKPNPAGKSGAEHPASQGSPAIEALTEKIKQAPNDASLYAARGAMWYENQNFDEGIADLEQAIKLDSSKAEYFHGLADMYMDYYKSRLAVNVMERAAAKFPKRIPTLLKLAEFQLIVKMHNEALFSLERIRAIDPLNAEMFFSFGNVFKDMGKTDQALNAYQSAVENDPDLIDAWINLANLLMDKNSPLVGKYLDNALRVDSNNIEALHAKAYFLSNKKNDLKGAVQLYKKINTINPQYDDGYYNAGLLYLDMDSLDQAYQSFDLAIKFNPTFAEAFYHRGVAAEMKGNLQQALSDYQNVLNLDPNFEAAKASVKRLKK